MFPVNSEGARDYWAKCLRTRLLFADVPAFSSTEIVGRTRNAILADPEAIQHLVTLTAARINEISVTAQLPLEVLVCIFGILTERDTPSSKRLNDDESGKKQHLGWINVTHVCRRRHVALSTPALWTKVGAPQTGLWMNEMLARSKQVPFNLSASVARDNKVCGAIIKAVSPEFLWRMKGLHLSDERTEPHYAPREHTSEAGLLYQRTLEILGSLKHLASMLESLILDDVTMSTPLPLQIFAEDLPRFRAVSFANVAGYLGKPRTSTSSRNLSWTSDMRLFLLLN